MLIEANGLMIDLKITPEDLGKYNTKKFFDRVWMINENGTNITKEKLIHKFVLSHIWNNMKTYKCRYLPILEYEAEELAKKVGVL